VLGKAIAPLFKAGCIVFLSFCNVRFWVANEQSSRRLFDSDKIEEARQTQRNKDEALADWESMMNEGLEENR